MRRAQPNSTPSVKLLYVDQREGLGSNKIAVSWFGKSTNMHTLRE